jgi:hypothetical protein
MKKKSSDLALGIAIIFGTALLCWWLDVERRALIALMYVILGAGVLYFWNNGSRALKVLAVALLPAILLRYLLPKKIRSEIAAMPPKKGKD